MKRKSFLTWPIIILAVLALLGVIFGKVGSHLPPKPKYVELQLNLLSTYAKPFKEQLVAATPLDNRTYVSIVKPGGSIWKYNDKGEVLDPWGQPYVITQNNGQIIITSPGLDQYNKLSSFQKWWSNE
jgi:hypothetical protein